MRPIDGDKLKMRMLNYYDCVNESTSKATYSGETLMAYEVAYMIEDCIDNAPTIDPERRDKMKNNNALIIAHFIFASIFVAFITQAAIHSAKYGLLWWYLLPTFTSFCCVVGCSSDSRKVDKKEDR